MDPSSFDVEHVIDILERTPKLLALLIEGLSEDLLRINEGDDTFSPADVVGHVAYVEEVPWRARLTCFGADGADRALPGVDRFAFRERYRHRSLAEQLEIFSNSRFENLGVLRDLIDRGRLDEEAQHPEFGTVTLRQLVATWVVHDLAHLNQIKRVVVRQFRDAVGPWRKYLRILES